jgi:transcriptional regulator with XRE-family HTH domain
MKSQIGFKIKNERRKQGISQAQLSEKLGISSSYLNLIESGKRNVNVDLLLKTSEILNIELKDLSKKENANLYHDVLDLLGDNIFEDLDITNLEVKDLANNSPLVAKALIRLGDFYKKENKEIYSKVESISEDNITNYKSTFPGEAVSDFLQQHNNYFEEIEDYATDVFRSVNANNRTRHVLLVDYLKKKHKIEVVDVVPSEKENFAKNLIKIKINFFYLTT